MIHFPAAAAERKKIVKKFTQAIAEKRIDVVRDMVAKHHWLLRAKMGKKGWTALGLAIKSNDANIVRTLLNSGATVDLKFPGGETPLILAVRHASEEIVSMLLRKGADVNHKSARELTALSEAKLLGKSDIVEVLRWYNLTNSGYKLPHDLPKPPRGVRLADGTLTPVFSYIVQIHQRRIGPLGYEGTFGRRGSGILTHRFYYPRRGGIETFDVFRDGVQGEPFVYDRHDNPVGVRIYRIITVET